MIGTGPSLPSGFYDRFEHRFTDVEQVRLHHVDGGRVASPCVVLMHGWPQTWYAWRKVMPELVDLGYRVIAVDYRGAGDSTRPATGYDKVTMAGDIAQLLTELGTGSVHLVARDVGLMVAYALATRWPETVSTLTMVDVPIPGTGAWERAKRDPATWHFGLHQQRDVAESLVDGREFDYLSTFYRARTQVAQAITDDDLAVYARSYAQPGGMRAGFELYRAFEQDEQAFRESLATKLAIPVLAVGGELDNATLIAETAHEAAENVTVAVVPGVGTGPPRRTPGSCSSNCARSCPTPAYARHDDLGRRRPGDGGRHPGRATWQGRRVRRMGGRHRRCGGLFRRLSHWDTPPRRDGSQSPHPAVRVPRPPPRLGTIEDSAGPATTRRPTLVGASRRRRRPGHLVPRAGPLHAPEMEDFPDHVGGRISHSADHRHHAGSGRPAVTPARRPGGQLRDSDRSSDLDHPASTQSPRPTVAAARSASHPHPTVEPIPHRRQQPSQTIPPRPVDRRRQRPGDRLPLGTIDHPERSRPSTPPSPALLQVDRLNRADMMPELSDPTVRDRAIAGSSLGRLGEPADVADVVALLASCDARSITGHVVDASCGLYLRPAA